MLVNKLWFPASNFAGCNKYMITLLVTFSRVKKRLQSATSWRTLIITVSMDYVLTWCRHFKTKSRKIVCRTGLRTSYRNYWFH